MTSTVRTRITGSLMFVFTFYRYGFGFVWENQGVCHMKRFLCEFRQWLIDCCLQDWHSVMASKDRLAFYSTFKKSHSLADYLFTVKKAVLRKHLVRFRLGVSPLKTHRLRYSQKNTRHFYLSILRHQRIRNSCFVSIPRI